MDLVVTPANPVPEGVVSGMLKTPDGIALRFARWDPPPGRKGTVCLFPGRAEFIEKYFETVRDLRARGFAVAMLDWRGQGGSQRLLRNPRKGYVRRYADYDTDLATFIHDVVLPDCPPPVFALAHSMGATILMRAAYQGHHWFERMVLLAPLIGLPGHAPLGGDTRRGALPADGRARPQLCAGRRRLGDAAAPLHRQSVELRPGALCAQRRGAGSRARARHRLADGGLGRRHLPDDQRTGRSGVSDEDPPAAC